MKKEKFNLHILIRKINSLVHSKYYAQALWRAVENNDAETIRKLLYQGADPSYLPWFEHRNKSGKLLPSCDSETLKLLVRHGLARDTLRNIFMKLLCARNLSATGLLELLLDHGLPVDDAWTLPRYLALDCARALSLLQLSIIFRRLDFVQILLKRGSDFHTKPSLLELAVLYPDQDIMEFLLCNGVDVNVKDDGEDTPLHVACRVGNEEIVRTLLEHGADVNALNHLGETPLKTGDADPAAHNKTPVIKKLARLRFENKPICDENLNYLRGNADLQGTFDVCLDELEKMRSARIDSELTLYDILKGRRAGYNLLLKSKSPGFIKELEWLIERESIELYKDDLQRSVEVASKRRELFELEEIKLNLIFKNHLPELVIRNVAYFIIATE